MFFFRAFLADADEMGESSACEPKHELKVAINLCRAERDCKHLGDNYLCAVCCFIVSYFILVSYILYRIKGYFANLMSGYVIRNTPCYSTEPHRR